MLGACVFTELPQTCYRGLANAKTKNAHSLETKSKAKLPIVKMEYCNQILGTINQTPDPQKAKAVHAIAFTITTFLSFHILSTTTGSSTRNKFGGLHKKNKEKGSSRAGSQEATMIQHPPLNVSKESKEGRRGSGITGGKAGYNIGRE